MTGKKKRSDVIAALAVLCLLCFLLNACATTDPEVTVRGQHDIAFGKVKRF